MIVTVVGWSPAYLADGTELASTGGFEWFYEETDARIYLIGRLAESSGQRLGHSYTITPVDVGDKDNVLPHGEEITRWLDANTELFEPSIPVQA